MDNENINTMSIKKEEPSNTSSVAEGISIADKAANTDISDKKKKKKKISKSTLWTIKITIITFCLSSLFSFLSEISSNYLNIVISICILLFLIILSIVFDSIGVAATSCEMAPIAAMAAKKVPGANVAIMLLKNAEKVSNICNDVIGDICSIISGTCIAAVVLSMKLADGYYWVNILVSATVAALTVGGKAFFKYIAIKNSKDIIMLAAKFLSIFYRPKKKKKKLK